MVDSSPYLATEYEFDTLIQQLHHLIANADSDSKERHKCKMATSVSGISGFTFVQIKQTRHQSFIFLSLLTAQYGAVLCLNNLKD